MIYRINDVYISILIKMETNDLRILVDQDFVIKRSPHAQHVLVKLLLFSDEGHPIYQNYSHTRIEIHKELEWLHQYDFKSITSMVRN